MKKNRKQEEKECKARRRSKMDEGKGLKLGEEM
jgi:hypothetical protein